MNNCGTRYCHLPGLSRLGENLDRFRTGGTDRDVLGVNIVDQGHQRLAGIAALRPRYRQLDRKKLVDGLIPKIRAFDVSTERKADRLTLGLSEEGHMKRVMASGLFGQNLMGLAI